MRQILKQLNFSEKEIDVYLAALAMTSAPVSDLAKKAGIKRPTAYVILEKRKRKSKALPKFKALTKKDSAIPLFRYYEVFKFMFDSLWKELEGKNLPDNR